MIGLIANGDYTENLDVVVRSYKLNNLRLGVNGNLALGTTIHSFIPAISIAPLQVLYYSEALPTTVRIGL